jgi:hypothetical protein
MRDRHACRNDPAGERLPTLEFVPSATLYVDDLASGAGGLEEAADVGAVSGDDAGSPVGGCLGDDGHVPGCGAAHELVDGVCILFGQGDDLASAQEPAKLDLGGGSG